MAASVSCGFPLWLDGMTWTGLLGRQYGSGTAVYDAGTTSALTPGGGVFAPGTGGGLAVTAPVSGMTVSVAAGYVSVPSTTAQAGAYIFGLMASASLTVASNATGSTRQDYVLANVSDVGSSSSVAAIKYVTGTTSPPAVPASSIILAQVAVTNGATNITAGMITDKRAWVVAPGCVLPIASAAAAPAAPASQFMYQIDTGALVKGSGSAGSVKAGFSGGTPKYVYGSATDPSVSITADGLTDYAIYYAREASGTGFFGDQFSVQVLIDGHVVDTTYGWSAAAIAGRFSATYYTSSAQGTRPAKGTHTVALAGSDDDAEDHVKMTLRVSAVST